MINLSRFLIVLSLGMVTILVQGTVLGCFRPDLMRPDLLLIVVVFMAFYDVSVLGAVLAFLLGLQFDLFSGMLLGPRAGSLVVVYGTLSALSHRLFIESFFAACLSVFLSSLLNSLVYMTLIPDAHSTHAVYLRVALIEAFFTAILAPLLLQGLKQLLKRKQVGLSGGLAVVKYN